MRRFHRMALVALLLGAAPAISGCADFDLDKLDVFGLNKKKPLPGERHAVFPEGVPGVTQGIPAELLAGYEQGQPGAAVPLDGIKPQTTAVQAAEEKPKPKPKPKKVAQTARPTRIKMAPQEEPPAAAQPATAPAASSQPAPQPAAAQQGWPAPAQSGAPWPAPTFSKQ
jgi:outer membrane biosynthesis protein TonB